MNLISSWCSFHSLWLSIVISVAFLVNNFCKEKNLKWWAWNMFWTIPLLLEVITLCKECILSWTLAFFLAYMENIFLNIHILKHDPIVMKIHILEPSGQDNHSNIKKYISIFALSIVYWLDWGRMCQIMASYFPHVLSSFKNCWQKGMFIRSVRTGAITVFTAPELRSGF